MGLISFLKEKFEKKKEQTDKYEKGMEKSRRSFSIKLNNLSHKYSKVDRSYFEELEEILLEADVGINLTLKVIELVLERSKKEKIKDVDKINEILIDELFSNYMEKGEYNIDLTFKENKTTVLLVVGVNGVGKTTSIAKLAYRYSKMGKKVMLVAADTFRAGAKEQLITWGDRLGIKVIYGKDNSDPASVAYEGSRIAKQENIDLLIVDTAGRLQTKNNLMMELAKIKRVIGKELPDEPSETFLVIDATTGQNGVIQAKAFKEVTDISGIVITKMDGTSKGGIILSIRDELGIPVRFIGLGETIDDLMEFDVEKYIYSLCVGDEDNG